MIPAPSTPDALQRLPEAIWIPHKKGLSVYRGSPLEIVRAMAAEMGDDVSVSEAVRQIVRALGKDRRLKIKLATVGLNDETLSRLFVYALIDSGVGKEMARA